jgi:hypothetical protein
MRETNGRFPRVNYNHVKLGASRGYMKTDFYKNGFVGLFEALSHGEYRATRALILSPYPCEDCAVAGGSRGVERA